MSESALNRWTSVGALLVCLAVGSIVVVVQLAGGEPLQGPAWLWWLCYGGFVAALATSERVPHRRRPAAAVLAVVLASGAVAVSAQAGWTPILLVFSAALAASVLSHRATALVVLVQSGVVAWVAWRSMTLFDAHVAEVGISVGFYTVLQAFVIVGVWQEVRQAQVREQLATTNVELQAARALLAEQSRSEERLRIARELHDLVGHQLTALSLELEVAAHRSTPPASEHVTRARRLAKELLDDVRDAVGELRTHPPQLSAALRAIAADLPRPQVHVRVDDDVEVDETQIRTLVRCTQEIVTNAIRHADADNVWIEVARDGAGQLVLTGHDDGGGTSRLELGHGLTGLKERVEELGGDVSIEPRDGFRVRARVPAP